MNWERRHAPLYEGDIDRRGLLRKGLAIGGGLAGLGGLAAILCG